MHWHKNTTPFHFLFQFAVWHIQCYKATKEWSLRVATYYMPVYARKPPPNYTKLWFCIIGSVLLFLALSLAKAGLWYLCPAVSFSDGAPNDGSMQSITDGYIDRQLLHFSMVILHKFLKFLQCFIGRVAVSQCVLYVAHSKPFYPPAGVRPQGGHAYKTPRIYIKGALCNARKFRLR